MIIGDKFVTISNLSLRWLKIGLFSRVWWKIWVHGNNIPWVLCSTGLFVVFTWMTSNLWLIFSFLINFSIVSWYHLFFWKIWGQPLIINFSSISSLIFFSFQSILSYFCRPVSLLGYVLILTVLKWLKVSLQVVMYLKKKKKAALLGLSIVIGLSSLGRE